MTNTEEMIEALTHCRQNMAQHVIQAEDMVKNNLQDLYALTEAILVSTPESHDITKEYYTQLRNTLGIAMRDMGLLPSVPQ